MKKLLLAVITVFFIGNVNAQSIKFGVKSGVNFATISGEGINVDSRIGFHIGGVAEINVSDKFSVQPELVYSTQGAKLRDFATIELDYISVPIMAKYHVTKGLSLEFGPQFSFLVNDGIDFENNDAETEDIEAENFDLSAGIGLGYKLDSGLFFQTRYNLGITTISENPDLKNGVFQVSVGYQF
jgi:opacity protein-like surface antigen